jgi:hypothetical protein
MDDPAAQRAGRSHPLLSGPSSHRALVLDRLRVLHTANSAGCASNTIESMLPSRAGVRVAARTLSFADLFDFGQVEQVLHPTRGALGLLETIEIEHERLVAVDR